MAQRSFYRSNASNQTLLPPTSGPLGHNDEGDPDSNKVCEEISRGSIGINNEMSFIKGDQRFIIRPPTHHKEYILYVTKCLGEPVLLEYDSQTKKRKISSELTYPTVHKEDFYKVGDIVKLGSVSEKYLYRIFPELAKPTKEHESILSQFIWAYLMGPPKEYSIGYSIQSITPYRKNGHGEVVYQGVLILDKKPIFLEKTITLYNINALNSDWVYSMRADVGKGAEKMALIMLQVLETMTTTGATTLGKAVAKKTARKVVVKALLKHTAKRSLQRKIWIAINKDLAQNFFKAATAATTEYIKQVENTSKITQILSQLDMNKGRDEKEKFLRKESANMRFSIITPALNSAIKTFATTLVSESLGGFFSKQIKPAKNMIINKIVDSTTYFLTAIAATLTTSLIDILALSDKGIKNGKLSNNIKGNMENIFYNLVKINIFPSIEKMSIAMTKKL